MSLFKKYPQLTFVALLYTLVLGPNLKKVDFFWAVNIVLAIIFSILFLLGHLKIRRCMAVLVGFSIAFTTSSCLAFLLSQNASQTYFNETLKLIILLMSTYVVALYSVSKLLINEEQLLHALVSIMLVLALTVAFIYVSPSAKEFLAEESGLKLASSFHHMAYRTIDLSVGGGTALSLVFILGVLAVLELLFMRGFSYRLVLALLIFSVVIVFSARTGLILLFIVYCIYIYRFMRIGLRSSLLLFRLVTVYAVVLVFALYFLSNYLGPELFTRVLSWVFEFMDASAYEADSGSSMSALMHDHLKFQLQSAEWLFGKNMLEIDSDIGFIKILHAGGILSTFLYLLFWGYLFFHTGFKRWRHSSVCFIYALFLGSIFIVNFKELIFSNSRGLFSLILFIFFFCQIRRCEKRVVAVSVLTAGQREGI
jgi:hypothetical protein